MPRMVLSSAIPIPSVPPLVLSNAATVFTISSLIIPSGISGFWRLAAAEDLNSTSPDSSVLMSSADPAPAQAVYQRDF